MPETRGQAGGQANAETHDHAFYQEIGRKGGEARAAAHHQAAGHHEAQNHAERGHAHSQQAHNLSRNALGQFISTKGETE